jgi:hypothetical protein
MALHLRKVRSLLGIERRTAPDDVREMSKPLLEQAPPKTMTNARYIETRERLLEAAIAVISLPVDDPRLDDLNEAINDCNRVSFDENGSQSSVELTVVPH